MFLSNSIFLRLDLVVRLIAVYLLEKSQQIFEKEVEQDRYTLSYFILKGLQLQHAPSNNINKTVILRSVLKNLKGKS